jgi:predicted N-formylglutamate amidohydrolase
VFLDGLRAAGFAVGDNEPYSGKAPQDFTIDHHAEEIGLPHVGIEVRQDLVDNMAGVARVAEVMHHIIANMVSRPAVAQQRDSA